MTISPNLAAGVSTTTETPFRLTYLRVGQFAEITRAPTLRLRRRELVISCPQLTFRLEYTPLPGLIQELPEGLWGSEIRGLHEVPSHYDAGPAVQRHAFVGSPLHGALHQILDGESANPGYCDIHNHPDAGELNVLLPGNPVRPLEFDLHNDGPVQAEPPHVMWIQPGAPHAAMATAGTGFFFALRVPLG